jgi:hypothetical protein
MKMEISKISLMKSERIEGKLTYTRNPYSQYLIIKKKRGRTSGNFIKTSCPDRHRAGGTCGFRIFVPLLIMGIANVSGYLNLTDGFAWIASYPALIVFSVATVLEVIAYFFPYVDNLLNAISTPASVIAGIMVTAAVMTDVSPILQWTMAIIAGGERHNHQYLSVMVHIMLQRWSVLESPIRLFQQLSLSFQ